MTLALLCGTIGNQLTPSAAAGLGEDLTAALTAAGARNVLRAGAPDVAAELRLTAKLARERPEPLLICVDNLVAHHSLLWTLATEPLGRSNALIIADDARGNGSLSSSDTAGLREERGRLVPAPDTAGTVRFLGALYVAPSDLSLVADAAERAAIAYESAVGTYSVGAPAGGVGTGVRPASNAVDALLPALLDAGLVPIATRVRLLRAERVHDDEALAAARATVAAVDEDAARLRLAVKERDDFFTTYAVSTWSPVVTRWCARLGLTPSGVTALSVVFAVGAAVAFWQASRPAMITGAILLYVGFVLDCVDGQLARYTRRFGAFGGWLDTMADRAKEYAVYAGLAAGAERGGLPGAWRLAIAAMLLQTVRHMTDSWYGALHDEAAAQQSAGTAGYDAAAGVASIEPASHHDLGARLSRVSNRVQADTGSFAYWLKRIVVFPIGERWALIALFAAFGNGRTALFVVLGWGALAAAYTLALRSLRSRSMHAPVLDSVDTSRHRDDGPLVRLLLSRARLPTPLPWVLLAVMGAGGLVAAVSTGRIVADRAASLALAATLALVLAAGLPARARHAGTLDWLVPAALRASEYLVVLAVGLLASVPHPVVFALLFVLALHHYDITTRMEKGAPLSGGPMSGGPMSGGPMSGVSQAMLGWDGRVALLVLATLGAMATAAFSGVTTGAGGGVTSAAVSGVATGTMVALAGIVATTFLAGARSVHRETRVPGHSLTPGGSR